MKRNIFLLICIVLLAAALRFFHLGSVPIGFIPEEVSTGWSSYTLLKTGADEWGTRWPIIFRETGGYKLILNGYLMAPVLAVFGLNETSVRSTTALMGVLAVFLTFPIAQRFLKNQKAALFSSFLLAISPWHISMSRYGVDVNFGVPLFLAGLWCFLKGQKRPGFLILSGVFFALTYYTYFNYIVFTVLFLLVLLSVYGRSLLKKTTRWYLGIFLLIQVFAFFPYIITNNLFTRFSQATSVQSIGRLNDINEHRGGCLARGYPLALCRVVYNKPLAWGQEVIRNWVNHASTTTFFLSGSNRGLSGMPKGWGLFYLFEFPLILLGLAILFWQRTFPLVLLLWLVLWALPSSLAGDGHIWRMMTVLPLPQILGGYGLYKFSIFISQFSLNVRFLKITENDLVENFKLKISNYIGLLIRAALLFAICFSLLQFLTDYFGYFPYAQARNSYYGFRDLYSYLRTVGDKYDNIVIAPVGMGFNQLYIYYLFYNQFDPVQFQKDIDVDRRVGEQGWVWVDRIGKYYFVGEAGKVRYPLTEKTLLIMDDAPVGRIVNDAKFTVRTVHTIRYPYGDPAFVVMELVKISP